MSDTPERFRVICRDCQPQCVDIGRVGERADRMTLSALLRFGNGDEREFEWSQVEPTEDPVTL